MKNRKFDMTVPEAEVIFGSKAEIARILEISPQAVSDWGDAIPELRQRQLYDEMDRKEQAA